MYSARNFSRNSKAFQGLLSFAVDLFHKQCSLSLTYPLHGLWSQWKVTFFQVLVPPMSGGSLAAFKLLALIHKSAKICRFCCIFLAVLAV